MSTFKVGDRVRGVSGLIESKIGRIIQIDTGGLPLAEFEDFEMGHDGDFDDDAVNRWWLYPGGALILDPAPAVSGSSEIVPGGFAVYATGGVFVKVVAIVGDRAWIYLGNESNFIVDLAELTPA
jgi:hypothetical protein